VVEYLAATTGQQGDILLGMLRRMVSDAYERGWGEGSEHARRSDRLIGDARDVQVIEPPDRGERGE
jgi:hypothetical protein